MAVFRDEERLSPEYVPERLLFLSLLPYFGNPLT
jgi:hypothetical protein